MLMATDGLLSQQSTEQRLTVNLVANNGLLGHLGSLLAFLANKTQQRHTLNLVDTVGLLGHLGLLLAFLATRA